MAATRWPPTTARGCADGASGCAATSTSEAASGAAKVATDANWATPVATAAMVATASAVTHGREGSGLATWMSAFGPIALGVSGTLFERLESLARLFVDFLDRLMCGHGRPRINRALVG